MIFHLAVKVPWNGVVFLRGPWGLVYCSVLMWGFIVCVSVVILAEAAFSLCNGLGGCLFSSFLCIWVMWFGTFWVSFCVPFLVCITPF